MVTGLLGLIALSLPAIAGEANSLALERKEYIEDQNFCLMAAEAEGITNPSGTLYELKDLSGNIFYAQIGEDEGFMVYDPVVDAFTEKSRDLLSPYNFGEEGHDYYYFGPMNYFERKGDVFSSLTDDVEMSLDYAISYQKTFDAQLEVFRNAGNRGHDNKGIKGSNDIPPAPIVVGNKSYVYDYQYIRDCKHPSNFDGSCGYVAASILLYYWHRTAYEGTVKPQYLDSNGELNDTGDTYDAEHNLKDKLVQLAGGETSSWGKSVSDTLGEYCEEYNLNEYTTYNLFVSGVYGEIVAGRPAILFGNFPNQKADGGKTNHAVVAYGIEHEGDGYYIVNYGWEKDTAEVTLASGFIASNTIFYLVGY